jgi:NAD(P)-dependent dehydrogenase (short-subunit alcohol dehydrogenase family)
MAQVADAQAVVSAGVDRLGRIDVLVNSTGTPTTFRDSSTPSR